jgi:hypothetical protein
MKEFLSSGSVHPLVIGYVIMLKEFQTRGLLDEIWGFQPGKNLDFVF